MNVGEFMKMRRLLKVNCSTAYHKYYHIIIPFEERIKDLKYRYDIFVLL